LWDDNDDVVNDNDDDYVGNDDGTLMIVTMMTMISYILAYCSRNKKQEALFTRQQSCYSNLHTVYTKQGR